MNDKLKELMKLVADNPEMEVKFMVSTEIVCDNDRQWWIASEIEKVEKDEYWIYKYDVFIGDYEIKNGLENKLDEDDSSEDLHEYYLELKKSGEIKEAIICYLGV